MRVYSFSNISVVLNYSGKPPHTLTGWADGDDVIQIARATDSIGSKVGAAGDMLVSVGADISGTLSFNLQITSSSNKFLHDVLNEQESGKLKEFKLLTVSFKDNYRDDATAAAVSGYIKRYADIVRGANAGNTQWTIVVDKLNTLLGDATDITS